MSSELIARVERVLAAHGLEGASAEAVGHTGEIASLSVPPADWGRMVGSEAGRISAEIRALGFRYVAVDLAD